MLLILIYSILLHCIIIMKHISELNVDVMSKKINYRQKSLVLHMKVLLLIFD